MDFEEIVEKIRADRTLTAEVPSFDPANGNETAKFLFLMEAPGPAAVRTGHVSLDNPDPTAANLKAQLKVSGVERNELALWNIVPWYISTQSGKRIRAAQRSDVRAGIEYLPALLTAMPNLCCIVLVGGAARLAHVFLSGVTSARILSCHHPSARVMNTNPEARRQNIEVFRFMHSTV